MTIQIHGGPSLRACSGYSPKAENKVIKTLKNKNNLSKDQPLKTSKSMHLTNEHLLYIFSFDKNLATLQLALTLGMDKLI